ncbi:hypothetical protein ABZ471_20475, partial [Streptomyces sp. NPDC005728]|uniref:hypothetical protein n=1 Tax=Streptomyces sp. NPDC005728 TaxID=3157054 RepID=UPI0033E18CB5
MRKFQRAALVAAVVAGLSTAGVGVSFADDSDGPQEVSAVASAQATAVVTWGAPHSEPQSDAHGTPHAEKAQDHEHAAKGPDGKEQASKQDDRRPASKKQDHKQKPSKQDDRRPASKKQDHKQKPSKQ